MRKDGPVINLYAPGITSYKLNNGTEVKILQKTEYPVNNEIDVIVQPAKPSHFVLNFRIPEWSRKNVVKINGKPVIARPGTYVKIDRQWKMNDKVTLELDLRGRLIQALSGATELAVMRGPVVLAMDNRFVANEEIAVCLLSTPYTYTKTNISIDSKGYVLSQSRSSSNELTYINLRPLKSPEHVWMAFEVPFLVRQSHFFNHKVKNLVMCDYYSAGNQFSETNLFRVWLLQPLYLQQTFVSDTWKVIYPDEKYRPVIPLVKSLKKKIIISLYLKINNCRRF